MISFDNGPADGDYVRYIDAMAKTAARTVADSATTQPTSMATRVTGGTGFDDDAQARLREVAARRAAASPIVATALQSAAGRIALPALGRASALTAAGVLLAIIGLAMQPTSVIALLIGVVIAVVGFRQASNAFAALRDRARSP